MEIIIYSPSTGFNPVEMSLKHIFKECVKPNSLNTIDYYSITFTYYVNLVTNTFPNVLPLFSRTMKCLHCKKNDVKENPEFFLKAEATEINRKI